MKKRDFRGIGAALVTPYTAEGQIDFGQLGQLVRFLLEQGIDGFYVAGSTSEVFLMTEEERMRVLETVIEANEGRGFVVSHVGAISTEAAIRYAIHAKEMGADAISAISPFYYHFTTEEIIDYYQAIMDSTDLPMFVYNFPAFSGFSLTEDVIKRLRKNPNLKGVKFTSSDMFLLERIKTQNPELIVWNGYDEMLMAGLAMGCDGGIGSTYNCMAPLIKKIYDCMQTERIAEAREYQRHANAIISVICKYGVFSSVKALLDAQGFDFHGCRKPFGDLDQAAKDNLIRIYREHASIWSK